MQVRTLNHKVKGRPVLKNGRKPKNLKIQKIKSGQSNSDVSLVSENKLIPSRNKLGTLARGRLATFWSDL